ncbi:UPF0415 protein C7orf25 homolog [Sycon ciliatum]|uniref:UPF0415 protein C7orf25 homolog n=1 Tax=Sycon ciliatum TaxID=27933 RepID=UPI0031F6B210
MAEPVEESEMQSAYRDLVSSNLALSVDVLEATEKWLKRNPQVKHSKKAKAASSSSGSGVAPQDESDRYAQLEGAAPPGLARLVRRVKAERSFLAGVMSAKVPIRNSHARSSNLAHLHAIFLTARYSNRCTAVLKRMFFLHVAEFSDPVYIPLSDGEEDYSSDGSEQEGGDDDDCTPQDDGASKDLRSGERVPVPAASHAEPTANVATATSHGDREQAFATAAAAAVPLQPSEMEQLLRDRLRQDLGVEYSDEEDDGENGVGMFDFREDGPGEEDASSESDDEDHCVDSVVADVIVEGGRAWIKVVARNPLSLHRTCQGGSRGHRNHKSVLVQAQDMLSAAQQNPKDYSAPRVVILFAKGVTKPVKDELQKLGVTVCGRVCPRRDSPPSASADADDRTNGACDSSAGAGSYACVDLSPAELEAEVAEMMQQLSTTLQQETARCEDKRVNLDVSTMLVLCSQLTHGYANYKFKSGVLNEQAARERLHPALPELEEFLADKDLLCCETARSEFNDIVNTVAGPVEKERARELMEEVKVVPDCPSQRIMDLKETTKIRERAKVIFGTGESMQLTTSTANQAFVRAAAGQGIHFSVFSHESRALTESKQLTAEPLPAENGAAE